jgi:hypothetical protein
MRARPVVIKAPLPCVVAGIVRCYRGLCLSVRDPPQWLRERLDAAREYTVYFAVRNKLYEVRGRRVRLPLRDCYYIYPRGFTQHVLRRLRAEGYLAVCLAGVEPAGQDSG